MDWDALNTQPMTLYDVRRDPLRAPRGSCHVCFLISNSGSNFPGHLNYEAAQMYWSRVDSGIGRFRDRTDDTQVRREVGFGKHVVNYHIKAQLKNVPPVRILKPDDYHG